jgi:hypothetical protein
MNSQHRETVVSIPNSEQLQHLKKTGSSGQKVFGMPVQKDFKNLFL